MCTCVASAGQHWVRFLKSVASQHTMTIWVVVIFARNRERTFQSSRIVAEIWSRLKAGRQTENCQDPEDQTSPRSRRKASSCSASKKRPTLGP